jgi:hypothetical protein
MVKSRSAESMSYPLMIDQGALSAPFPEVPERFTVFSDRGSWLFETGGGSSGLVCLVVLSSLFIGTVVDVVIEVATRP